jgi:fatty acid desaturase
MGTTHNPYIREDWQYTKLPHRIVAVYLIATAILLSALVMYGNPMLLAILPLAGLSTVLAVLSRLPERVYYQSKIRPLFSIRALAMMRTIFFTLLLWGLAWATWATGDWWAAYFLLLWVVPLVTTFPLYMVLRQIVQHGNGDRGWLSNSRVFLCHPFINFAVFPLGQDYHLPHHMFSTVPHYRLKELHEVMMEYPEYGDQATVVEGYIWPKERPPVRPTVVDVLGPEYAPHEFREVFIDNTVLEGRNVTDREKMEIMDEGAREAERVRVAALAGSWNSPNEKGIDAQSDVA